MAISEELELDISGALDAIESLNEPLTQLGENLTITLSTAIEAVDVTPLVEQLAALDASGLTTTIDAAVNAADGTVPIEADTDAIPGEIDSSIAAADTTVTLEADTSDFGGSIDEALAAADATVTVDADASGIGDEIESEIASADTTVVIEADGSSLADLGADAEGATAGLDDAASSISGLAGAGGAVVGGDIVGGLSSSLGKAGPAGAAAAAGIGIFTAGVTSLVGIGTEALATQQRFADTFGNLADQASRVKLGDLNADLGELAIKLGSDDEGLQDAAASIFQFGKASGFTSKQSLELVNNAAALAARAVALNPALGQVGDVAEGLTNAFAKGGKFATKYGLALTAQEIADRARANTGKESNAQLTVQEKSFAGAQIAAEKYGKGIDKTINKGSKNAAIQQRSLNEQLNNFLEEAGKPLVAPFQELLKALLPTIKAVLPIFTDLAKTVLPVLAQVLKDNAPQIKLFGELFKELSPILTPILRVSILMASPISAILALFRQFGDLPDVGGFFTGIGDAISGLLGTFADLGDSFLLGGQELFDDFVTGFGQIGSFFTDLGDSFLIGGKELLDDFLTGLEEAVPAVLGFLGELRDKIVLAVGNTAITLVNKGIDLIVGLVTGILQTVGALFRFWIDLPGRIFGAIGDVAGTLFSKGVDLIQGLLTGLVQKGQEVINFITGIPDAIVNAIAASGALARKLFNAGLDLVQGLIDGIINKASHLIDVIKKQITDKIPNFIKDALGIGSPSKVLEAIGEDIGAGLVSGIDKSLAGIEKASQAMVDAVPTSIPGPTFVPAALPIPGISNLPAVAAALPSVAAAATTAGTSGGFFSDRTAAGGVSIENLIIQTPAKDQTQVGIETAKQLRAESFRAGR